MPFLIGLSTVPDVRQVLSVIHKDHVVNLNLALELVQQLQPELYPPEANSNSVGQGTGPKEEEDGDIDSDDSINDRVMISDREWGFSQQDNEVKFPKDIKVNV